MGIGGIISAVCIYLSLLCFCLMQFFILLASRLVILHLFKWLLCVSLHMRVRVCLRHFRFVFHFSFIALVFRH